MTESMEEPANYEKDGFQVFLVSSPLPRPFSFALHTWLVTVKGGIQNRWEVWQFKSRIPGSAHGGLY